ncbi:MAG: hypothetical protein M3362_00695 [Acidobacteriota bacterium]|nr:hypothetical protein [Acidobacteriota bacterium]
MAETGEQQTFRSLITEPYRNFAEDCLRLSQLLFVLLNFVILEKVSPFRLDPSSLLGEDYEKVLEATTGLINASGYDKWELGALQMYLPLLAELTLCRAVDGFLTFLAATLSLIFRTKPETLRSSELERLDFILQFPTMEELVTALAERRVDKLSYGGMREITKYFEERLGLQLFDAPAELDAAVRFIEVRNIIVHNRGVVSSIFKKRLPDASEQVGDRVSLTPEEIAAQMTYLAKLADRIDARAVDKFGLPTVCATPSAEAGDKR